MFDPRPSISPLGLLFAITIVSLAIIVLVAQTIN